MTAISVGLRTIAELTQSIGLVPNKKKSGAVGSNVRIEMAAKGLLAAHGFHQEQPLKDLGVVQGRLSGSRKLADGRWHTACERLGRIAFLPLSKAAKGVMAASTATAAATYGAGIRTVSLQTYDGYRAWIKHAVLVGSRYADVTEELTPCFKC